jgi:hypothetical protein
MFRGEQMKPCARLAAVGEMTIPARYAVFNEEFRSTIKLSRSQIKKLANEVIESGPEIVECFADEDADNRWNICVGDCKASLGVIHSPTECHTSDGRKLLIETLDVFPCPDYSRAALIKGWFRAMDLCH